MIDALLSRYALRGLLLAVFAFTTLSAQAQVKPFNVTGGGPAPDGVSIFGDPSSHFATGNATLLGQYEGEGVFDPSPLSETFSGTFQGTFVFVAANGDELACTYGDVNNGAEGLGEYQIFPAEEPGEVFAVFVAEFNPVPEACTGRFQKVRDGSLIMVAVSEPFALADVDPNTGFSPAFDYSWEGEGWLEFERGAR